MRQDCRAKISQHGALGRLFCLDAAPAAETALRRTLAGEAIIVPGLLNRALAGLSRLVPLTTILAIVSAFWGKTARRGDPAQAARKRPALGPQLYGS
jgi:hypothetical protein